MPTKSATPMTSFPKSQIKVLLLESIHDSAHEILAAEGFQVERIPGSLAEGELAERVHDVHVIGVRSKTRVTEQVLARARPLLGIGCFCIGTNQVDLKLAGAKGIPVFNAPFSNTRSVAELVLAEIVMLARQLGDRNREVHRGIWNKSAAGCHEIRGKTLGIIGYGHIGSQVGILAEAFGMRVIFYDIAPKLSIGNARSIGSPEALLQASDFVTLHVPATPRTNMMIGAPQLGRMRAGAFLLNLSRGSVVDHAALTASIRSGHIAGAAIDVYPDEPSGNARDFSSTLRELPNVVLTPHIGGSTEEAQAAIGVDVARSLTKFVNTGATTGAVNFPHVELDLVEGTHRILNAHRNVPGVMRDINAILTAHNANIHGQYLATDAEVGYSITDLDRDVSNEVKREIAALSSSIKTRILY